MRMRRSVARACTAVALAALPCACAERLMPTPVGFAATGGDPFARTPAHARTDEVKLYVASNRGVRANAPPDEYFTTERSEQLRLGTMGVAIAGDGMPWPELEGVSRTWPREDGPEVSLRSIDDFGPVWQGIPGLATSAKSDAAVIAAARAARGITVGADVGKQPSASGVSSPRASWRRWRSCNRQHDAVLLSHRPTTSGAHCVRVCVCVCVCV
jgi:hypothetical protein